MKVVVIDYGMSNLGSIRRSLEECGADVIISDDPQALKEADHIILPGVGAFPDGMHNLSERGWVPAIRESALQDNIPLLGICLGMQLLADEGYEITETKGLGLIPGAVKRFIPDAQDIRIPHVGWNEIHQVKESVLLKDIADCSDFYFVHSYYYETAKQEDILATTPYCGHFSSIINSGNIFGVQFHPEKSGKIGFRLLKNFLNLRGGKSPC